MLLSVFFSSYAVLSSDVMIDATTRATTNSFADCQSAAEDYDLTVESDVFETEAEASADAADKYRDAERDIIAEYERDGYRLSGSVSTSERCSGGNLEYRCSWSARLNFTCRSR